jgi:gluconolactonase
MITRGAVRLAALLSLAPALLPAQGPGTPSVEGRITRFDPRFDQLVPAGAALEVVSSGHDWVEGPLWDRAGGCLRFSDVPRNSVYRWCEGRGDSLLLHPSGYSGTAPFTGREPGSNGLAWDSQGRLLLAEHGDRRIARLGPDGRQATLADRYMGQRFNSPNDLIVLANGDILFTDPPFGLPGWWDDPAKETPWQGVYRVTPAGDVSLLTSDLRAPNGIALSPDGKTLFLSDANPDHPSWWTYPYRAGGTLGPGRLFYDGLAWKQERQGVADGLKLDRSGNLFGAGPGGIYVFAGDGTLLGVLETGSATGNCAWGEDGSTLFIAAGTKVFRLRTGTRGAGW